MSFSDAAPTEEELKSVSSFDDHPPTPEELDRIGPHKFFTNGTFDTAKYMAANPQAPGISAEESALRGAGQGATAGFGDEASGALEAGTGAAQSLVTGENAFGDQGHLAGLQNLIANYQRARDTQRGQNLAAAQANPKSYLTGQIAGGIPLGMATGAAGEAAMGGTVAAPLTGLKAIGASALTNGAQGAATSVGLNNSSNPADLIKDAAKTGILSAGIGAGFTGGGQVIQAAGRGGQNLADYGTIQALGQKSSIVKNLVNQDEISPLAQWARDKGIVGFTSTPKSIAAATKSGLQDTGEAIGGFDQKIDQIIEGLKQTDPEKYTSIMESKSNIPQQLEDTIIAKLSGNPNTIDFAEGPIQKSVSNFERVYGNGPQPMDVLRDFKSGLRDNVNFNTAPEGLPKAYAGLANTVEQKMANIVDQAENAGNPGLSQQYQTLNKDYGNYAASRGLSADQALRNQRNNALGLSSLATGNMFSKSADSSLEGGIKGILGAITYKTLQSRGMSVASTVLDKVSKAITETPQVLGPYSQVLTQAAQRGPSALAVSHYVLSESDPKYRDAINQLMEGQ